MFLSLCLPQRWCRWCCTDRAKLEREIRLSVSLLAPGRRSLKADHFRNVLQISNVWESGSCFNTHTHISECVRLTCNWAKEEFQAECTVMALKASMYLSLCPIHPSSLSHWVAGLLDPELSQLLIFKIWSPEVK